LDTQLNTFHICKTPLTDGKAAEVADMTLVTGFLCGGLSGHFSALPDAAA
jgi:hypothetical protein